MKVGQMKRREVFRNLERAQTVAVQQGDTELAGRIGRDMVTLEKSRGDTLYDMYLNADRRIERHDWYHKGDATPWALGGGMTVGIAAGVGVALANQLSPVAGAVMGGAGGVLLGLALLIPAGKKCST